MALLTDVFRFSAYGSHATNGDIAMWYKIASQFTPSAAGLTLEAVVAMTTGILAATFVFATVLPPVQAALIG